MHIYIRVLASVTVVSEKLVNRSAKKFIKSDSNSIEPTFACSYDFFSLPKTYIKLETLLTIVDFNSRFVATSYAYTLVSNREQVIDGFDSIM